MDDDDLFSMLPSSSKAAAQAPPRSSQDRKGKQPESTHKKRSASSDEGVNASAVEPPKKQPRSLGQEDVHDNESESDEDPMAALDAGDADQSIEDDDDASTVQPAPVVTDDFEQEAEREVAASKGFAATDEGEKMKLVHQVRHQVSKNPFHCQLHLFSLEVRRSHSRQTTPTSQSQRTSPETHPLAPTNSRSTLSNASP